MGVWFQKSVSGEMFFVSKLPFEFQGRYCKATLRTLPSESRCRDPPQELGGTDILMDSSPMLDPPHTRLPHIKQKKKKSWESTWLFSYMHRCNIFFQTITLYKLWARFIRKKFAINTGFLKICSFLGSKFETTCFPNWIFFFNFPPEPASTRLPRSPKGCIKPASKLEG